MEYHSVRRRDGGTSDERRPQPRKTCPNRRHILPPTPRRGFPRREWNRLDIGGMSEDVFPIPRLCLSACAWVFPIWAISRGHTETARTRLGDVQCAGVLGAGFGMLGPAPVEWWAGQFTVLRAACCVLQSAWVSGTAYILSFDPGTQYQLCPKLGLCITADLPALTHQVR